MLFSFTSLEQKVLYKKQASHHNSWKEVLSNLGFSQSSGRLKRKSAKLSLRLEISPPLLFSSSSLLLSSSSPARNAEIIQCTFLRLYLFFSDHFLFSIHLIYF